MSDLVQGKTLINDAENQFKIDPNNDTVVFRYNKHTQWFTLRGLAWASLFEDEIFYEEDQQDDDS